MDLRSIARRGLVALPLLLLGAWIAPLAVGARSLVYRDVLLTHLPLRAAVAAALRAGEMPLLDPFRGAGQPLLGNANAAVLYPDSLLLRVADPLWVLNAHFWIHWLIAPFAMAWLARAWGIERRAAWMAGVTYAFGGFFVSMLNLHNLVAGAALAPAFVAACLWTLEATRSEPRVTAGSSVARRGAAVALSWFLLVTGGGPSFALGALGLAAAALALRQTGRRAEGASKHSILRPLGVLAAAVLAGTTMAAPLIVETLRILPTAYRSHWSIDSASGLAQSWHPAALVEWLVPFALGEPGPRLWGIQFTDGEMPLVHATSPGWIALALVATAAVPWRAGARRGAILWGWGAAALGVALALGSHNPLLDALARDSSGGLLRFPVKAWLLASIGLSLLAGCGAERLLAGERRRRFAGLLGGALALTLFTTWEILRRAPWLVALLTERLPEGRPAEPELERMAGSLLFAVLSLVFAFCLSLVCARAKATAPARASALSALLALHAGTQLLLLAPLLTTVDAARLADPPKILEHLPPDAEIVHALSSGLFGGAPLDGAWRGARMEEVIAGRFTEAPRFAGVQWGRRYLLDPGPDGLDTLYGVLARDLAKALDDEGRLHLARTYGVDRLVLFAPLDDGTMERFGLREVASIGGATVGTLRVLDFPRSVPSLRLVGETVDVDRVDDALRVLIAPDADPHRRAVVPRRDNDPAQATSGAENRTANGATGEARPPGRIVTSQESTTRIVAKVDSPSGGLLVAQRAWLPGWSATVDGQPVDVEIADLQRLGVPVEAGRREVRLHYDTRPVAWAFGLSTLTAFAVLVCAIGRLPRTRRARRGA